MASLQHQTPCRPQRCLQLPCRAEQAQAQPAPVSSRRRTLGAALLLPTAALAAPRPSIAEELTAVPAGAMELQPAEAASAIMDVAGWPQWVDRTFSFSYPPGFKEVSVSYAAPPPPRAGAEQTAENPLKAEVRSPDEQQRINVVVRQASALKRTLFQVTDVTQLGDAKQVANLLLPPGATVVSFQTVSVAQAAKDTGTVLGVIERDPINYYSYDVVLPDRTHLQLTAAAQLGRLYVLAASAPDSQWQQGGAALREAALSFRLRYKS